MRKKNQEIESMVISLSRAQGPPDRNDNPAGAFDFDFCLHSREMIKRAVQTVVINFSFSTANMGLNPPPT